MVWRNNTGKFRSMTDPQRIVSVGQVGSADIIGVQPVTITPEMVGKVIGQAIAIEVITQVFDGLKKAGLTAAKTVGEWVGIGKGEAEPYTLKINGEDRKSTRLNSSHSRASRMPSSA